MEEAPRPQELIETPNIPIYDRNLGRIEANWLNSVLTYSDHLDNYLEFSTGEDTAQSVMLTDKEWEVMMALEFPWQYIPDVTHDAEEDVIKCTYLKERLYFYRLNTAIRLYKDKEFNHVEHRPTRDTFRRLPVKDSLMKQLMSKDYAVKWSPIPEPDVVYWHHGGET